MKRSQPLKRRQPLPRGNGPKRTKPITPRRKTARRGRIVLGPDARQALRHGCYDRAGGLCEAGTSPTCPGWVPRDGFEWHHRKLRSQGGNDVPTNSLCVCPPCHAWIHAHPEAARSRGLIVRARSSPTQTALTLPSGRIVLLTPDLTYDPVFPTEED